MQSDAISLRLTAGGPFLGQPIDPGGRFRRQQRQRTGRRVTLERERRVDREQARSNQSAATLRSHRQFATQNIWHRKLSQAPGQRVERLPILDRIPSR